MIGWSVWSEPGSIKGLIGIDVPHPRKEVLVQQGRFEGSRCSREPTEELGFGDFEGIWAMVSPVITSQIGHGVNRVETAKSTRISPDQANCRITGGITEAPENMPVLRCSRAGKRWFKNELPSHTQSEFEHTSILDLQREPFSMAMNCLEPAITEKSKRTISAGNGASNDIWPAHANTTNDQPDNMGGKGASYLLYLRQLGHRNNQRYR